MPNYQYRYDMKILIFFSFFFFIFFSVIEKIRLIAPELRSQGQKAVLVIFTDGQADDGSLIEAMKPLKVFFSNLITLFLLFYLLPV
jgi:hypothetical protein